MAKKDNFFNAPWSSRGPGERVLIISGSIGAVIGSILLIRGAGAAIAARKKAKVFKDDKETFEDKGQKLTYPGTQYYQFADQIYEAMNSTWYDPSSWGTGEEAIASVMYKMKNDLDVLQLIRVFGKRDGETLAGWMASEMDPEEISTYANMILAKKGIKFRF